MHERKPVPYCNCMSIKDREYLIKMVNLNHSKLEDIEKSLKDQEILDAKDIPFDQHRDSVMNKIDKSFTTLSNVTKRLRATPICKKR